MWPRSRHEVSAITHRTSGLLTWMTGRLFAVAPASHVPFSLLSQCQSAELSLAC